MTKEQKQSIQHKIEVLKEEMKDVHGPKCEVFSRVVGYLRPVQNWNRGKKQEYSMRKMFKCSCD